MKLDDLTHKRLVPFLVSFAFFMEALDSTIINTAIPAIAQSLTVNPVDLKIALISYLMSLAVFIPISGWFADKWGAKRVLILAFGLFTLASLWCGFAASLTELVIARLLQGLGGAMMLPVGRLILVRTVPRHEIINVMSRVIIVGAMGVMLGPVLGGVITHYFSWHWIFWVNIPVGIVAMVLLSVFMAPSPPRRIPPLDKIGFILFGTGLACFTFGLSLFSESDQSIMTALGIIGIALTLLLLYTRHSRRKAHPIVKVELFRLRTFRVSVLGNLFSRLGFGGIPFLMPLLFQVGLGYSSLMSGLLIAPLALGIISIKPFVVRLMRRFGYRKLLILNTWLLGIGLCLFTVISHDTPLVLILIFTFGYGFLASIQYSSMNSLAYIEIEEDQLSAATSIMSTLQQVSQSFGVAVGALLLRCFATVENQDFILTPSVFHLTFISLGILTWLSVLIFWRLKPGDGNRLIYGDKEPATALNRLSST